MPAFDMSRPDAAITPPHSSAAAAYLRQAIAFFDIFAVSAGYDALMPLSPA
jgi:hypothetical protein